jgi:actin
LRRFEDFKV